VWYRLSGVQLAHSLYRDLLFRKFCHFELGAEVPEASTLGRFRNKLVEHDRWDRLPGEMNRQLEAKNIIMAEGRINIIDATLTVSAMAANIRKGALCLTLYGPGSKLPWIVAPGIQDTG